MGLGTVRLTLGVGGCNYAWKLGWGLSPRCGGKRCFHE